MKAQWVGAAALVVELVFGGVAPAAEFASTEEMDKYVAAQVEQDLKILKNLKPRELYVAPDGKPGNSGSKEAPLDFKTAFTNARIVTAGTCVWVKGGKYELGSLEQSKEMKGTREQPVIFRAVPGERATIVGELVPAADHLWLWGLDVTGPPGSAVRTGHPVNGLKVINCTLRDHGGAQATDPKGHGIAGWDVGNDHEFYGNIIYGNGWNTQEHGFYSQNQPSHTAKRYVDNIVAGNTGCGFHLYGSAPYHYGYYLEGNVAFATSILPRKPDNGRPQMNILIGGKKPVRCVILRDNIAYHPKAAESKRCVDIGYSGGPNYNILVEGNYFMGGVNAFELRQAAQALVRNNTFWAPNGMVSAVIIAPGQAKATLAKIAADPKSMLDLQRIDFANFKVVFEGNRYIDNGKFDLAAFQAATRTAETGRVVRGKDGRPADVAEFKRVNRYEPDRVHLTIFNWPKTEMAAIDLSDVLKPGDKFRIVDTCDRWGAPVKVGTAEGQLVELKLTGAYAPEFACYLLFRGSAAQ